MARLRDEKARLNLASYPQIFDVRAAYADVDSFQHLNNVAMARYFEEGRAAMNMHLFGVDTVVRPSGGVQLLFATITIDYVAQGAYPGVVTVATGISKVGRSSFNQAGGLFQDERCIALCEAVTVYAVDGAGKPLPDDTITAMRELAFAGS
ncbi:MAG: acyl-CoA thioesterase [Caulobacterales bacterium]